MSNPEDTLKKAGLLSGSEDPFRKGQEFFQIFVKVKEFTEDLLKENERLRFKIASLESGLPPGSDDRVRSLHQRIRELEERLADLETRYKKVEEENKEFADRYIEIEEQNNNLANLYVASYQLHSTLDYKEVIRIVQEIIINLIGAEAFHIWMVSEKAPLLEIEGSEGQTPPVTSIPIGDGIIGSSAQSGENHFAERVSFPEPTPYDQPIAVIPLKIKEHVIGVISINKLLVQKKAFTTMDYELFTLLAGHAATAIFSAKLYSTSARKLTTLQGFIDMLKTQPAKK
jgi:nitrate/nitrite-specific signal transduction histidine kinase